MRLRSAIATTLFLASAACGSTDDGAGAGNEMPEPEPEPEVPIGTNGTLPCEPLGTRFAGDENCILPAEEGTGVFIHVGPDDYDDPEEIAKYVMSPEDESTQYYLFNTPNDEIVWFFRQHYRMRPGSHHLIVNSLSNQVTEEGWYTREEFYAAHPDGGYPIAGTQRSVWDYPPTEEIPPEDQNLARPLGAHVGLAFELHFVNSSPEEILREVWVNFMENESEQREILGGLFMIGGGFSIPPNASQTLSYSCELGDAERRIVSIFGHRHANTDRFSVWANRGGERELVYEDYDWDEPAELVYNSVVQNGAPNREANRPGGFNGILTLNQGDRLDWECEVNNRSGVELTFKNEVFTGEMCNIFGSTAKGSSPIWFCRGEPSMQ